MNAKGIALLYTVSFPAQVSEGEDVYYTLFNSDGTTYQARTKTGVVEFGGGTFGVVLTFNSEGKWFIFWDVDATDYEAGEEILIYDFASSTDLSIIKMQMEFVFGIEGGRWKIVNDQMIFYKADNITEIARFNLFDDGTNVIERTRV